LDGLPGGGPDFGSAPALLSRGLAGRGTTRVEDAAGSMGPVGGLEGDALVEIYRTNAVDPALVTQGLCPP
jgi:hypothetical protein